MSVTPAWFGPAERRLAGWWHVPASGTAAAGVVLCPPLGREHICSHPAYRELAETLSARGLAVLRFDYDGTGDSAGALDDPDRVPAWIGSIHQAVAALRAAGVARVCVVGMRVGAVLALAASDGAAADALVLWDPVPSAGAWLRQQRTLLALSVSREEAAAAAHPPIPPRGHKPAAVETPGYVFDEATVTSLRALDAASLPVACPALVLLRPATPQAPSLVDRLRGAVTWETAAGQSELLDVPEYEAVVPEATVEVLAGWLATTFADAGPAVPVVVPTEREAVVGENVTETMLQLADGQLYGVLTQPAASRGPMVVLLNNGTELHTGPSRLWVSLARAWAAAGLTTLRLDLSGIGESPPRPGKRPRTLYAAEALDDVVEAVGELLPARVVLAGLCSGAYTSIEAALALRAEGVIAINPPTWVQTAEESAGEVDDERRQAVGRTSPLVRALSQGPLRVATAKLPSSLWTVLDRLGLRPSPAAGLRSLVEAGIDITVIFGNEDAEPFLRRSAAMVRRLERRGLQMVRIPGLDHAALLAGPRAELATRLRDHVVTRYAVPGTHQLGRRTDAPVH